MKAVAGKLGVDDFGLALYSSIDILVVELETETAGEEYVGKEASSCTIILDVSGTAGTEEDTDEARTSCDEHGTAAAEVSLEGKVDGIFTRNSGSSSSSIGSDDKA